MAPAEQPELWRPDRDRRVPGAAVPDRGVAGCGRQDLHPRLRGGHPRSWPRSCSSTARRPSIAAGPGPWSSPSPRWSPRGAPTSAWSPASGASCGSPEWPCWQVASWPPGRGGPLGRLLAPGTGPAAHPPRSRRPRRHRGLAAPDRPASSACWRAGSPHGVARRPGLGGTGRGRPHDREAGSGEHGHRAVESLLGRDGLGRVARIAFHGRGTAPTCSIRLSRRRRRRAHHGLGSWWNDWSTTGRRRMA
jgi:hypothetical protein